jgi:formate dehydrogenase assembly factor FdhD
MDIKKIVNEFPTKYSAGFTDEEISNLLEQLNVNEKRFNKAMGTNTCAIIDGNAVSYHTDIIRAISITVGNI